MAEAAAVSSLSLASRGYSSWSDPGDWFVGSLFSVFLLE
jgi:hypothetical protein